ncbi:response regulator transcription factor [Occallatibacter riparius]|uniref:Response regulator transcription factor n=1 Tax=Occallatibacter riparius TaxID=1002689 RepID=A0A9J7BQS7_9BACT|nr:response regulator transcription factor [Occallatibacter riparius]UWZ85171.1 response regulator transcription factor [Occallatibacter riparius]
MMKHCKKSTGSPLNPVDIRACSTGFIVTNDANPIRLLVVDDHPVLREGLAALIGSQHDMTLVAEAGTGKDAVALYKIHRPDVTIMDIRLPDMNGIAAISEIREQCPSARIIVLTTYLGDVQAERALKAGAQAFLLKATLRTDLLDCIRDVNQGKRRVHADVASEMAAHFGGDLLTAREIEVLQQVASGKSNRMVADYLEISEDTVKTHIRSILDKLGANDRTHAVTIALRRGFLDL